MDAGRGAYDLPAMGSSIPAAADGRQGSLAETMATIVVAVRDAASVRKEGNGRNAGHGRGVAFLLTIS